MDKQSGQSSTNDDEYLNRARELRERASRSGNPQDRILLIEAAHLYECMAEGLILPLPAGRRR